MLEIKGVPVKLYKTVGVGVDEFDRTIYSEEIVEVPNVLIQPVTSDDMASELNISGKRICYELSIPKGDKHDWTDVTVEFYDEKFITVGYPIELIDEMTPLSWNKKVKVERYG